MRTIVSLENSLLFLTIVCSVLYDRYGISTYHPKNMDYDTDNQIPENLTIHSDAQAAISKVKPLADWVIATGVGSRYVGWGGEQGGGE
jgi:hypothetical protein